MDGVGTLEYCDGAHGPYRCTSDIDTVALLGSRFTETHHVYGNLLITSVQAAKQVTPPKLRSRRQVPLDAEHTVSES